MGYSGSLQDTHGELEGQLTPGTVCNSRGVTTPEVPHNNPSFRPSNASAYPPAASQGMLHTLFHTVQTRLQRAATQVARYFRQLKLNVKEPQSIIYVFGPQEHHLRPRETHSQAPHSLEEGPVPDKELTLSNLDVSQLHPNWSAAFTVRTI